MNNQRLKGTRILVASIGSVLNDPPSRNCVTQLVEAGARVVAVHRPFRDYSDPPVPGLDERAVFGNRWLPRRIRTAADLAVFTRTVRAELRKHRPSMVISIMMQPLPLMGKLPYDCKLVAGVLDIPPVYRSGAVMGRVIAAGWKQLRRAQVVWASDIHKAELAFRFGDLGERPLVCHNCPRLDYLPKPLWPRDPWLRAELQRQGARIGVEAGCILLRAGAVGECGGIEETLEAIRDLPENYIFLMMGRLNSFYKAHLLSLINRNGLEGRAFIWDRPTTDVWKRALQGADVGHLIHGPFISAHDREAYKLNSSLSNNRLYQYMAAGLPIVLYDDPRMDNLVAEVDCFRVARIKMLATDLRQVISELGGAPALRQALGTRARAAHMTKYNWEHQFAAVFQKIEVAVTGS